MGSPLQILPPSLSRFIRQNPREPVRDLSLKSALDAKLPRSKNLTVDLKQERFSTSQSGWRLGTKPAASLPHAASILGNHWLSGLAFEDLLEGG